MTSKQRSIGLVSVWIDAWSVRDDQRNLIQIDSLFECPKLHFIPVQATAVSNHLSIFSRTQQTDQNNHRGLVLVATSHTSG